MKINQLRVTIQTGIYPKYKPARVEVLVNGISHAVQMEIPDDDFQSRFEWMMEDVKRIILEKVRTK